MRPIRRTGPTDLSISALSRIVSPFRTSTSTGGLRYHHWRMRTLWLPGETSLPNSPSTHAIPTRVPSIDTENAPSLGSATTHLRS